MVAEVVVGCSDLDGMLAALAAHGFRLEAIHPADEPAVMHITGHGLRIRLVRDGDAPRHVRIAIGAGATARLVAGATQIELVGPETLAALPPLAPSLVVTRAGDAWRTGRAGMQYRDLIPDRQGGRFIASHIRIVEGGPVPDYVHYHAVRFQMIYCRRGWVTVVYEDRGEPFTMREGDCVVQPPEIRHRVLACSPGLEVIEVGSPAVHETRADHELALPTGTRDREYGGQRFVWHRAHAGPRDLEVGAATRGLARAHVRGGEPIASTHGAELLFGFVLCGEVTLGCGGEHRLARDDAFVVPPGRPFTLADPVDLEWLEVAVG